MGHTPYWMRGTGKQKWLVPSGEIEQTRKTQAKGRMSGDFEKENKSGASRKKTNTLSRCMHGMMDRDSVRFGKKNKS
jgi:hypothetical protein